MSRKAGADCSIAFVSPHFTSSQVQKSSVLPILKTHFLSKYNSDANFKNNTTKHDGVYFSVRSKHLYIFYISNLFTCPVSKLFTDAHAPPLDHWSVLSVSTSKWLNYLCKEVCILSPGKAVFLKDTCHPFI